MTELSTPQPWRQISTMRQNRHCQFYWQTLHPEKNVMRSTVLQVRGHKSPLLLGGKTLGLRCSADADKVMNNKCRRGADSGQNLLMRCGQWAQIFCPRHLYCGYLCNSINCGLSRKSHCIRPTSGQAVANSALG